ncbi:MAG: thioredoxin [Lachnospiraceae bacterium]|nr:thioredoxin [Lachnospiraceae bacterium]
MAVIELTNANFDEVVGSSDVPVLVDFWAPWCGPCRMLSPVVEEVAEEAEGFKVGKVNVEEFEDMAMKFGISNIPCLILFKEGKEAARSLGFIKKEQVLEFAKS